jgi:hypothetical protein
MIARRIRKLLKNSPALLMGYNPYVDTDKLRLIDMTFRTMHPAARSFADLGGVWKVNAAYSRYTLRKHTPDRGVLVDTDFPPGLQERLSRLKELEVIEGDFSAENTVAKVGAIDVTYFFDVLLHQANPSWDDVLARYASICSCFVIFNQQFVGGEETVRLTDLTLEEYKKLAPRGRDAMYQHVYEHAKEIHPKYGKPWRDIHNIFQWGITDKGLRTHMEKLGFREVFSANYGQFSDLPMFENHGFIFLRQEAAGRT